MSYRKSYHVEAERISTKKRIARAVIAFLICVAATYAIHRFRASAGSGLSTEEYLVDAVIAAATDFFQSGRKGFDVEVDDETIQVRAGDSRQKVVRRGRIRYIREVAGGLFRESALMLSERGRIATFFFGAVWIPTTIPDYEQVKSLAMSWRAIG